MSVTTEKTTPTSSDQRPIRVGDLLLARGYLSQEQLSQALAQQKQSGQNKLLGEILVEMKLVSEEQVLEVLAQAYGIPFARISSKIVDSKTIEILPRDFMEKNCVLPMFLVQGKLTIAVHEPTDVFLIEEIQRLAKVPVQIVAATTRDIRSTLQVFLPAANVFVIDEITDTSQPDDLTLVEKQITDLTSLENGAKESPVIKLVNFLISSAVQDAASDIHIEAGDKHLRVRYRVDGVLFEKISPPWQMHPAVVSRIKIMAGLDISERRIPQDGGMTVMLHQRPIDLRVSTMPGKFGEKVVIRILDNRNVQGSIETLGFSYNTLQKFRQLIHQPNGIVLVTGPTGSGKSTTLYAALHEVADDTVNICTVEDPVEYNLHGINQFQVHDKVGFTFASALRSLLRQDPDVIMLGEIRDPETARIATQAALTGHLVLSTLHTNDAAGAITRLFNIGIEPYLVAASLRGVLAQRLLRKICTHCKQPLDVTPTLQRTLQRLGVSPANMPATLFHGPGCPKCRKTGYSGRIGIYELLTPDDTMLDAISRGSSLQEIRRLSQASGTTSLAQDGLEKVLSGLTTLEELLSAIEIV